MDSFGFNKVISDNFDSNFILIAVSSPAELYRPDYVREIIKNYSSNPKNLIHFISCTTQSAENVNKISTNTLVYHNQNLEGGSDLIQSLSKNKIDGRKNIILIEDMALLLLSYNLDDNKSITRFLRFISRDFSKIVSIMDPETLRGNEISLIYEYADTITHLSSYCNEGRIFHCTVLRISSNGKIKLERSVLEVANNLLTSSQVKESPEIQSKSQADMLKNLTTFKLTLEENEKDSKERLNLPYFQAQTTDVPNPDEDFYDDEDDDDED